MQGHAAQAQAQQADTAALVAFGVGSRAPGQLRVMPRLSERTLPRRGSGSELHSYMQFTLRGGSRGLATGAPFLHAPSPLPSTAQHHKHQPALMLHTYNSVRCA